MASEWLSAAKNGDLSTLQRLLSAEPGLLQFTGKGTPDAVVGSTALHWAASKGHDECVAYLLAQGADVHARNHGDSSPLHCAALSNRLGCAAALAQHGADARLQDEFGDSPLSLAQRAGLEEMVALLEGGSDSAATGAQRQQSVAPERPAAPPAAESKRMGNEAFKAGRYEEALALYEDALAVEVTAPSVAAAEAAAALRSNRSACYAALKKFDEALDEAQQCCALRPGWAKGHSRVGAALHGLGRHDEALAAYAEVLSLEPENKQAADAVTALKVARRNARLEALIDRGAFNKKSATDGNGGGGGGGGGGAAGTGAASADGSSGTARRPKKERTPEEEKYAATVKEWHGAAKTGQVATLARLLKAEPWLLHNRSERTAEQQLGNTALHWAAAQGQKYAVEWLLQQKGVDVNARNHGGGTPLHSAAAHARGALLSMLLEAGADDSLRDELGETARDAATRRGYRSAEVVLDRGPSEPAVRWSGEGEGSRAPPGRPTRPADAEAAKALGNAAFAGSGAASELARAVWHYTDALLLGHPTPSAIESNRSGAHARLGQYHAALEDADAAVARRPDWGKAHGRRGAALHGLQDWARCEAAYVEGLRHEPGSAQLQQGLEEARAAAAAKQMKP